MYGYSEEYDDSDFGYNHNADRESSYCDRCGYYHSDQVDCG